MLRRSQKQLFHDDAADTLRSPRPPVATPRSPAPAIRQEQVQRVADRLASGFAAGERDKARRIFVELYGSYGRLERQLGIPAGDPDGATAALIAASYMAYADTDLDDAAFRRLHAQLRGPVAAAGAEAHAAEPRVTMAILATYLAATREALKAQPDPARSAELRQAGKRYLGELLGVDASRVRIGTTGLMLR
ncbi:DUF6683 family protein [Sphingomonas sp. HT-1]|uniref:DUF6683 family protein n=1 Tax=unclassified Sphingomonas TaxID=196159 RepID=UPI0002F54303|nr:MULTISPECIES: DUF6683 family protein [unclassified Sphingomonas]KTF68257.1 hypothetical protein ATB93_14715 [Sphingomonas sp. WG]